MYCGRTDCTKRAGCYTNFMKTFPSAGEGAIYFKWWFWVGLVVLVCATAYAVRYTSWNAQYLSDHAQDFARNSTLQVLDYQNKQLEAQYKADIYGGDTPEETLKLFVGALEKKDFELASKYYVPEKQAGILKSFKSNKTNATDGFISAYKNGKISASKSEVSETYGIDILAPGDKVPFYVRFIKNPFTNKWKITEPS